MQRHQSGFTLIELLIVVLIIGVLAGIAIPVFNGQRNKAKESVAKSQIRAAVTAVVSYRVGHNDTLEGSPINTPAGAGSDDNQKIREEEALFSSQAATFDATAGPHADPSKIWFAGYTPSATPSAIERGEVAMVCNASRGQYSYCAMMAWGNARLQTTFVSCAGGAQCTAKDGVYYGRAKGAISDAFVATMSPPFGLTSIPVDF